MSWPVSLAKPANVGIVASSDYVLYPSEKFAIFILDSLSDGSNHTIDARRVGAPTSLYIQQDNEYVSIAGLNGAMVWPLQDGVPSEPQFVEVFGTTQITWTGGKFHYGGSQSVSYDPLTFSTSPENFPERTMQVSGLPVQIGSLIEIGSRCYDVGDITCACVQPDLGLVIAGVRDKIVVLNANGEMQTFDAGSDVLAITAVSSEDLEAYYIANNQVSAIELDLDDLVGCDSVTAQFEHRNILLDGQVRATSSLPESVSRPTEQVPLSSTAEQQVEKKEPATGLDLLSLLKKPQQSSESPQEIQNSLPRESEHKISEEPQPTEQVKSQQRGTIDLLSLLNKPQKSVNTPDISSGNLTQSRQETPETTSESLDRSRSLTPEQAEREKVSNDLSRELSSELNTQPETGTAEKTNPAEKIPKATSSVSTSETRGGTDEIKKKSRKRKSSAKTGTPPVQSQYILREEHEAAMKALRDQINALSARLSKLEGGADEPGAQSVDKHPSEFEIRKVEQTSHTSNLSAAISHEKQGASGAATPASVSDAVDRTMRGERHLNFLQANESELESYLSKARPVQAQMIRLVLIDAYPHTILSQHLMKQLGERIVNKEFYDKIVDKENYNH